MMLKYRHIVCNTRCYVNDAFSNIKFFTEEYIFIPSISFSIPTYKYIVRLLKNFLFICETMYGAFNEFQNV